MVHKVRPGMEGQIFKGISNQLHSARPNCLHFCVQKSPISVLVFLLQSCGEKYLEGWRDTAYFGMGEESCFYLIAMTKMPDIAEGCSILTHSSEGSTCGSLLPCVWAGHFNSSVWWKKAVHFLAGQEVKGRPLYFCSLSFHQGLQPVARCHPHSEWTVPSLETSSQTHPELCVTVF